MKKIKLIPKLIAKFLHKWSIHLFLAAIVILLLIILRSLLLNGSGVLVEGNLFRIKTSPSPSPTPILTPSPTPSPTPKTTATPIVIYKEVSAPTPIPTQAPLPTQDTRVDSATKIELCKLEADKTKRLTMELWVKDFNNKNPEYVELAQTSDLAGLEQVEIKYGRIKPGDLVANYSAVATALYTAGAESKKFVGEYMNSVNFQAESVYNNAYANCLNRS